MAWSDAARAAALEARRMHAKKKELYYVTTIRGALGETQKFYNKVKDSKPSVGFTGKGAWTKKQIANAKKWKAWGKKPDATGYY